MKGKGWYGEPTKHRLSALGVSTKSDYEYMPIYPMEYGDDTTVYSMDKDGVEMRAECDFEEGYCHLYHLYVPKEKRGEGIGTTVIQEMEDIASSEGLEMMFVSVGEEEGDLESFMKEMGYDEGHLGYDLEEVSYGVMAGKYHKSLKEEEVES